MRNKNFLYLALFKTIYLHMAQFSGDDELIGLAAQIQSAPGTYALLLGAGISIAAGIKTGWQILEDLCRKLAVGHGDAPSNPTGWYATKYGTDANYSTVLEQLAQTPAGRNALVRSYIDPTPDELDNGLKAPTKAHRAIARMVRKGLIRVILTLNFDDLLERALRDEGVTPVVITRAEDIAAKPPYVHNTCTLFKLHGHYTDFTTLNTGSELEAYAASTSNLLKRVLEDFGLITCGWSGQWDTALIEAVKDSHSPYQVYFTNPGAPGEKAQSMIAARNGIQIKIKSADSVFEELEDISEAIEMLKAQSPQTLDLAIALTKRYLSEPKFRLMHRDMILAETNRVLEIISDQSRFTVDGEGITTEFLTQRWRDLVALTLPLTGMLSITTAFGENTHQEVVRDCIERLGKCLELWEGRGTPLLTASLALPLVLSVYAAGIAAILTENGTGLDRTISAPRFANGKSIIYDLHHDLPFANSPSSKPQSPEFRWDISNAGLEVGDRTLPNESVLLRFIHPTLATLGFSERRMLEASETFSYQRQILAFRECSRILANQKMSSNEAVAPRDRAKSSLAVKPSSTLLLDRAEFQRLRKSIGAIGHHRDNHWLVKALWDGTHSCLVQAYRDWMSHIKSEYTDSNFEGLPDWSQIGQLFE
jgi:hypothetical protein